MKKIALILLLTTMLLPLSAQRFIGSAILGMNASQVAGDRVAGFNKIGINGGASVMVALDEKQSWFLTIELLYNQKGAHRRSLVDSMARPLNADMNFKYNRKIKYRTQLDYVSVPVLFHFESPRTGWAFGAGVSWGRLVSVKEIENGYRTTMSLNSKPDPTSQEATLGVFSRNDWSVVGDIKFMIYKGLKFNFRYEHSFIPIRTRNYYYNTGEIIEEAKQYSYMLTFRLIYSFNEKYKRNEHKNKKGNLVGPKWVRDVKTN